MRLIDRKLVYSGWGRFLTLDVELGDGRRMARQLEDHGEAAAVLRGIPRETGGRQKAGRRSTVFPANGSRGQRQRPFRAAHRIGKAAGRRIDRDFGAHRRRIDPVIRAGT